MELNKEKYLSLKGSRKIVANALLEESEKFLFLDIEEIAAELEPPHRQQNHHHAAQIPAAY